MIDRLLKRRSHRSFEDKPVEKAKAAKIIQAAQLSPSGKNTRPWEFIIVEDKETLQKLGDCRNPNQPFLPKAPLAIITLGNTEITDTWIEDTALASMIMQLEAEELGLGSCWVQIRQRESNQGISSEEYVRNLLGIPEHMGILNILVVGYPDKQIAAHTLDEVKTEKIHTEIW